VGGPHGDDTSLRPNQLLAVSLPYAALPHAPSVVRSCDRLVTSLGLRTLSPDDPDYRPHHRGTQLERDRAAHQGTIWPWLVGPYISAAVRSGIAVDGMLDGLVDHLGEWGLGSVSQTVDADPPHAATGCPFSAWAVAELLRARRVLAGRA